VKVARFRKTGVADARAVQKVHRSGGHPVNI
jgi:hypothetical protein